MSQSNPGDNTIINPDDLGSNVSDDEIAVLSDDSSTEEETSTSETEEKPAETETETDSDTGQEEVQEEGEEKETEEEEPELEFEEEEGEEEGEEDEIKVDENDDVDIEDETEVEPSGWQKFKAKYPDAAKDKLVKSIFFRHQEFNDKFPGGLKEADTVIEKSKYLDFIDGSLADGDPTEIIKNIDEPVRLKLAEKVLPALEKVDRNLFAAATKPVILSILRDGLKFANDTKNDNLRKSIRNFTNFLTGQSDLPSETEDPRVNAELGKIQTERKKLEEDRLNDLRLKETEFLSGAEFNIKSKLEKSIGAYVNKQEGLTNFAKQAVVEKTIHDIRSKLSKNERFMSSLKVIKQEAIKNKFDKTFEKRLVTVYLQTAKRYASPYLKKHLKAALGETTTESGNDSKNRVVSTENRVNRNRGEGKDTTSRSIDMSKTSPEDFLAGNVVYR